MAARVLHRKKVDSRTVAANYLNRKEKVSSPPNSQTEKKVASGHQIPEQNKMASVREFREQAKNGKWPPDS